MADAVVAVLLALAAALLVLAALGVLVTRDPYDRLHFTAPPAFAGVLVAAAAVVHLGFSMTAAKVVLLAAVLVVSSPVSVQVIARATRACEREGRR